MQLFVSVKNVHCVNDLLKMCVFMPVESVQCFILLFCYATKTEEEAI